MGACRASAWGRGSLSATSAIAWSPPDCELDSGTSTPRTTPITTKLAPSPARTHHTSRPPPTLTLTLSLLVARTLVGRALSESDVPRKDLFLADKLSFAQSYSAEGVRKAVAESLRKLRTTYLDLYMLHSVGPSVARRYEAWREMIAMQKEGKIKHIGVSNFGTAELRDLKATTPGPTLTPSRLSPSPSEPSPSPHQAAPDAPPVTLQSKLSHTIADAPAMP